jgi:hypothetical protein
MSLDKVKGGQMPIYATKESVFGRILEDASIVAFETEEEARAYLLEGYDPRDWDLSTAQFSYGHFGDCWIKLIDTPEKTPWIFEPFTLDQLIISGPGQHPGHGYWIEPYPRILVLESIEERD